MKTFLQLVAHDLYTKVGNDLSRVAIVFPNKRAGLFFSEHLAEESDLPLWSPAYVSISDLFRQLSALKTGDPIRLVCELYKIFREETKSEESLDDFYFWGELLISDFDDADKNLVDADRLFVNLKDLKNIMDDFDFLDKEQEAAIQQFFQNFSIERRTELKERFTSVWDKLGDIYRRYRENLSALGIAYEGMLYREVMERLDTDHLKYDTYVFVGFNVLNRVETEFFLKMRDAGKAMFYWDYDEYYTSLHPKHEAGEFILRNLKLFPNELSAEIAENVYEDAPQDSACDVTLTEKNAFAGDLFDALENEQPASCSDCSHSRKIFDNLRHPKKIRFISAPTENAQARFLPQWVRDHLTGKEKENAVVLCNEALLLPVLHSIPEEVKNVNITMGFPLAQTPVYSFVSAALELQTNGYRTDSGQYIHEYVQTLLKHPYTRQLSSAAEALERELTRDNRFYPHPSALKRDEFLTRLFTPCNGIRELCLYITELLKEVSVIYREASDKDIFNQLYQEALFKTYTVVNRLLSLVENGELTVRVETIKRLMIKILSASNIPFHGEPAVGMQVMGVLETRNLDFRNVVLLSLNEGQLPKAGGDSSFIPYNLRKAFGMTTIEHKNAVYAYYFYRLIQRAENVTLLYNTASDGLNRGEWSRFMLQLLVEWPHSIEREYLEAGQSPQNVPEIRIEKSREMVQRLADAYDITRNPKVALSPSALNCYLDCRLRFYFRYIARVTAPDEVSSEIDSALFGTIFHRSAELAYNDLTAHSKEIHKEDLERLMNNDVQLQSYVDTAFKECFFHVPLDTKPEYNGVQLINSKVIVSYLRQLLRNDLQYAPFEMKGMEQRVREPMDITLSDGQTVRIQIGGIIDRMDSKDDTLRIVDYKTGGDPKIPANIEQLFTPAEGRPGYIFQTFLYAAIMCRKQPLKVAPSLLYIHRAASETYSPVIEMGEPRKPKIPVNNFAFWEDDFRQRLSLLLNEIFATDEPFTQTEVEKNCTYCDFKEICKR